MEGANGTNTEQLQSAAQTAINQFSEINQINENRDRALNLEKAFNSTEQKVNEFIGTTADSLDQFRA